MYISREMNSESIWEFASLWEENTKSPFRVHRGIAYSMVDTYQVMDHIPFPNALGWASVVSDDEPQR